ncbi:DUF2752 domain-containing protein [Fulvivirgaceae bacterium PWU5]|uniref:DUF2752 domain-containing protein n=1 Tax=Dawidia cretensis TaxID=2782350 RepID=A0AAP2E334_9BACT|nr:DUF2752 domain-containing protein [Dawidia cretensis]MBT1712096.1 DUF2752 domain-containing protein [Dawidia cretensis]
MALKDRSLYRMIVFLLGAGYAWLGYHLFGGDNHAHVTLCMFKDMTGVPCPSCGITRSLLSLLHGNVQEALWINPLGFVAALLLTILPAWVLYDGVQRKRTLPTAYRWAELQLQRQKLLYVPLIALILVNWGWNILKDL